MPRVWTAFAAFAAIILSAYGCADRERFDPPPSEDQQQFGELTFALELGPDVTVGAVSYVITGPGNYEKTGSFDVSSSNTASTHVRLPVGQGYVARLDCVSTDDVWTCAGTSPEFGIEANRTTHTDVTLRCRRGARQGTVEINGTFNLCPEIVELNVAPLEASVGSSLVLSAQAADEDDAPSPLAYQWTTTGAGTFEDASEPETSFTCTEAGTPTLTLTVTDGDPECETIAEVPVSCSIPLPEGETENTPPEESQCPNFSESDMGSNEDIACQLLIYSQLGYFPDRFNYVHALRLVDALRALDDLQRRNFDGELSVEDARQQAIHHDEVCSSISGVAACAELIFAVP